jgi:predicted glycoside hydrolase/deacetylase ChbG (UPF0249 family)
MILVVNADDAGVDPARNRGILRAAREGLVRSASVLVSSSAAREFVELSRRVEGLGVGLHLNLTEGAPLVRGHESMVDGGGAFLGKRVLWERSVAGLLDPAELRREIEAQWMALESLGVAPTHVDGHNHAHIFPGIAEAFLDAIPPGTWVRLPRQGRSPPPSPREGGWPADIFQSREVLASALRELSARALDRGWSRYRFASRFEGTLLRAGYGEEDLLDLLSRVLADENGVVELMTHPGETCQGSVPYSASADRLRELEALTSPRVLSFARERGIRLSSFGSIPPGGIP